MSRSDRSTFGWTLLASIALSFALAAVVTPPDPFVQVYFVVAAMPVALVVSYVLAYRGGYDALQRRIRSRR